MKKSKIIFMLLAGFLPILWVGTQGRAVLRSITFHDDFDTGDLGNWQFPFPEDWKILGSPHDHYLHMLRNREPGEPRRPLQFALIKGPAIGSFDFQTRVRREGK